MVRLNHAVALAMLEGPGPCWSALRSLSRKVGCKGIIGWIGAGDGGDFEGAVVSHTLAAARTGSLPEREYLLRQARRLRGSWFSCTLVWHAIRTTFLC